MAKRWYVIHTYSGYENKVKTDLEHRIEIYGLQDKVGQLTQEQLTKIAEIKMPDLNAIDIEGAKKIIAGTARSMGVTIAE